MNTMFRKTTLLLLAVAFAFGLGACNTMKGVGRDVENAGEAVQDAATK